MLKTFRIGGVHPSDCKLSANQPILVPDIPPLVMVPLNQNLGAPSVPVVKRGDTVRVGTLIAKAGGFVGANIHSPVSGIIVKIEESIVASGYRKPSIFIEVQGDEWEPTIDRSMGLVSSISLSKEEIIQRIADCGIVGLGGAAFPTHVKLQPPPGMTPEVLIINAVECEPYLTCDHRLMLERHREIVIGVRILMKALSVDKAYIGIENNKPDAIQTMLQATELEPSIEVVALKVQYPQGGEKQLIDAVIKRQVGSGQLPVSVGAVVQNVATTFAVYEAVQKNKPLVERVVTITGKKLERPSNFMVRIGIPLSHLVELAGGVPDGTGKVILGGPMMGRAVSSLDLPVVKDCSGVLLMDQSRSQRSPMRACIRCAKCIEACPMGLEPYLLQMYSENQAWEKLDENDIMDCITCGCCQFTCPANRTLLDYLRIGKDKVAASKRK